MLSWASRRRIVVATSLAAAALALLLVGGGQPLVLLDPTFHSWYWSTGLMWAPPLMLAVAAAVGLHLAPSVTRTRGVTSLQAAAIGVAGLLLAVPVCVAVWVAELALMDR